MEFLFLAKKPEIFYFCLAENIQNMKLPFLSLVRKINVIGGTASQNNEEPEIGSRRAQPDTGQCFMGKRSNFEEWKFFSFGSGSSAGYDV